MVYNFIGYWFKLADKNADSRILAFYHISFLCCRVWQCL